MELTLSVIKADVGGYIGHSSSHPDVIQKAKEKLEHAQRQGLLIDHHVTVCGDDLR
jgi:fructose 1,6-bisphosphate aldolase/phosphatase